MSIEKNITDLSTHVENLGADIRALTGVIQYFMNTPSAPREKAEFGNSTKAGELMFEKVNTVNVDALEKVERVALAVNFGVRTPPNFTEEEVEHVREMLGAGASKVGDTIGEVFAAMDQAIKAEMHAQPYMIIAGRLADEVGKISAEELALFAKQLEDSKDRENVKFKKPKAEKKFTTVYWKDDTDGFGSAKTEAEWDDLQTDAEISGVNITSITKAEFDKLVAASKADEPAADIAALRTEGLNVVKAKAREHREAITNILTSYNAVDNGRPSWGLIADEHVQAALAELKAL